MGLFSSPIKTLDDLFNHTLQDIYYAEQQIAKNLPTMVEKASNPELKSAFQQHLSETQQQAKRLEQVFGMLGKPAKGVTCAAMDGILSEAKEIMSDCDDNEVRDAAMLSAAQTQPMTIGPGPVQGPPPARSPVQQQPLPPRRY